MILFGQNSTIRLFPLYPMPVAIFAEDKGVAFGTTLGCDFGISDNKAIEFNFKPRLFFLDGDETAYEFRFNINYKRFLKYNFFSSTGIACNLYYYESYGLYSWDENTRIFTIGPNLVFGRRTMLNKHIFLDTGLGGNLNFTLLSRTLNNVAPLDWYSDDMPAESDYSIEITHNQKYISYLSQILVFQFGYIF